MFGCAHYTHDPKKALLHDWDEEELPHVLGEQIVEIMREQEMKEVQEEVRKGLGLVLVLLVISFTRNIKKRRLSLQQILKFFLVLKILQYHLVIIRCLV